MTERPERERADQEPEEVELARVRVGRSPLQGPVAAVQVQVDLDQDWGKGLAGWAAAPLVWVRDRVVLVRELRAEWDQGKVAPVEDPRAGDRGRAVQVQDLAADQAVCGAELATTAEQALFRESSPVSLVEPLAGEVSRRKKSFLGFLER